MQDASTQTERAWWLPLRGGENEHKAAIRPSTPPTIVENEDEEQAQTARQLGEDAEDQDVEMSDDDATTAPPLTREQEARKSLAYQPGDIVAIEYEAEEGERIGAAEVVRMEPATDDDDDETQPTHHRQMVIRWLYDRDSLLGQPDGLDQDCLETLNFEDGDMAFSDHEQTTAVFNCTGLHSKVKREDIHFRWTDGKLTLTAAESTSRTQAQAAKSSDLDLPRHLRLLKEWLTSYKPWHDTKFGQDLWFLLHSLLSMGHANNTHSRSVLMNTLFRLDGREIGDALPAKVPWSIEWEEISRANARCDACGIQRFVSWRWKQTGWLVGRRCKERMAALQTLCSLLGDLRCQAAQYKEELTLSSLTASDQLINRYKQKAMEAMASSSQQ